MEKEKTKTGIGKIVFSCSHLSDMMVKDFIDGAGKAACFPGVGMMRSDPYYEKNAAAV